MVDFISNLRSVGGDQKIFMVSHIWIVVHTWFYPNHHNKRSLRTHTWVWMNMPDSRYHWLPYTCSSLPILWTQCKDAIKLVFQHILRVNRSSRDHKWSSLSTLSRWFDFLVSELGLKLWDKFRWRKFILGVSDARMVLVSIWSSMVWSKLE